MRGRSSFGFLLCMACATSCVGTITPTQRVQEAATDMNTATRFGRMDVALERVDSTKRSEFLKRRAAWGNAVRVMDCDLVGIELKDIDHAEVRIAVSWQRLSESEMRSTTVAQRWEDHRGKWVLLEEERGAGDTGLFGEAPASDLSSGQAGAARFPTITIR